MPASGAAARSATTMSMASSSMALARWVMIDPGRQRQLDGDGAEQHLHYQEPGREDGGISEARI